MVSIFPRHLKVGTVKMPSEKDRYIMLTKDGTAVHTIESSLIQLLSEVLNFNYTFVVPEDLSFGLEQKDGNWTGLVGKVQRGDCDLSFDLLGITESRTKAIDYSYPYYLSGVTFLTQKPQPLAKNLAIFYPFSFSLWMIFLAFILGFSALFCAINLEEKNYVRTFLFVLGSAVEQTLKFNIISWKHRIIFLGWIIGMAFLIHSYKALLLSFLFLTPMKGISTINEMSSAVAGGTAECITYKGSYLIKALLESSDDATKVIGKSLQKNSLEYVSPESVMLNETQKYSFIAAEISLRHLQTVSFMSKESFFPMVFGIPIWKNFCCKKVLNKVLQRIVEAGLFEKILKDIDSRFWIRDAAKYKQPETKQALKLQDIAGAIAILVCGNMLAFFIFVAEKLCFMKPNNGSFIF